MFKLSLASIVLALAASVAAYQRGMTTNSGTGFPPNFPPQFPQYKWALATYERSDCTGYSQPVCSLNDMDHFGYRGCGNLTFTKEDGIKAVLVWVNPDQPEMDFRVCNHPNEDEAASHCHKFEVEPNSWKCVVMVTNDHGEPAPGKDIHNLHKVASISECDKK